MKSYYFLIGVFIWLSCSSTINEINAEKETVDSSIIENIQFPNDSLLNHIAPVFLEEYYFKSLNTDDFNFRQVQGKVILLDFWATWCVPCKKEQPVVVDLIEKINNDDFEVVSVSIDKDVEAWRNYFNKNQWAGININIDWDPENPLFQMVSDSIIRDNGDIMFSTSVPQYFIIDKNLTIEKIEEINEQGVYERIIKKLE